MGMRLVSIGLCLGLTAAFVSGCKVPFTTQLRDEFHLTQEQLPHVQYYLSHDLTLRREVRYEEKTSITPGHKLRKERDRVIEEIEFKSGLPGVVAQMNGEYLHVSFEEGNTLPFRPAFPEKSPQDNKYILQEGPNRTVKYGDAEYFINCEANPVYLTVKKEELSDYAREHRSASGMRLK